jgi:hypothetical protein
MAVPTLLYARVAVAVEKRCGAAERGLDWRIVRPLSAVFLRPHAGIEVAREIIDIEILLDLT